LVFYEKEGADISDVHGGATPLEIINAVTEFQPMHVIPTTILNKELTWKESKRLFLSVLQSQSCACKMQQVG